MTLQFADYDELVHRIYDAALAPERWPAVVGAIGRALNGQRGALFTPFHTPHQGGFSFIHNIPESIHQRWASSSMLDDPMAREAEARGLFFEGNVFSARELVPVESLLNSRLFKEIWGPLEIWQCGTGIVFGGTDSKTLPTAVCIYRHRDAPSFSDSDLDLMRRLMAHMSRSLGVMFHLRDRDLRAASNLEGLERLAAGVVLLGEDGGMRFSNRSAERILRTGMYVVASQDAQNSPVCLQIAPRLTSHRTRFRHALRLALKPLKDSAADHFSRALVLPQGDGQPGCVIHIAPLGRSLAFAGSGTEPKVIVFIYELAAAESVAPALLIELFGLTPAEARAAHQIVKGGSAKEMALRLGVSQNTIKSHLRAVYAKTRTSRSSDLLKLLLALAMS